MFFGFEYKDGINTTTGSPNTDPGRYNGRLSIAGDAYAFEHKIDRDFWVFEKSDKRESVSIRRLRYLKKGMTAEQFTEYLEVLKWESENEL